MSTQKTNPTAGIILIGNELLSGQTVDLNLNYIAKKLFTHGVDLCETSVIPDLENEIIRVVRDYSKRFTHVFTTGGIGPTHDDITAETISKAFGRKLVRNEQVYQILVEKYGEESLTDSRGRMTMMPEGVELILNDSTGAPGFRVENVFVMAGVPTIMHAMFENALTVIPKGEKRQKVIVSCKVYESRLALGLHSIQDSYPQIEIGSYPHWIEGKSWGVRVAITGRDLVAFDETKKKVLDLCQSFDEKSHCLEE
ncbi:MAG TPA: competence/damage-inducible protein A [Holosporales bacterium]|nr:competence/damage-inducible protein A [Holosporales bacterium]